MSDSVWRAQAMVNENPNNVNVAEAVRSIDQYEAAEERAEKAEKEYARAQDEYEQENNALARAQQNALETARE